jgi:hypothetical protein
MASETCLICFEDYLVKNTKDHQCPENWSCGACGEICEIEDGTISLNQGLKEFTHKAELCPAQDEEIWANLPTTCPDFVSHPHIVNGRGCYTCQMAQASEEQGTTALMSALLDLKIPCDVHQTGGFTMCVYIKTGEHSFIYANEEGFGIYENDEDEGSNTYFGDDFKNQKPSEKAQKIAETMKAKNLQALEI